MKERIVIFLVISLLFSFCVPLHTTAYEENVTEDKRSISISDSSNSELFESNTQPLDTTISEKKLK